MATSKPTPRLKLLGGELYLCREGEDPHRIPVGPIAGACDHDTSNPYDFGSAIWDEFELFGAPVDRYWLRHSKWEDPYHLDKRKRDITKWYASTDRGRTWPGRGGAPSSATRLHKITNR